MTRLRKRILLAAALLFLIYSSTYLYLRFTHHLVHHIGWEFDPVGARVAKAPAVHSVRFKSSGNNIGYSGYSFPSNFHYWPEDCIIWHAFSPAAELEKIVWRIFKPSVLACDPYFGGNQAIDHAQVRPDDWHCFQHLCTLQSVMASFASQHQAKPDFSITAKQLSSWWGPRNWIDCLSSGHYIIPSTIGGGRPTCTFHGDLLSKYNYPDEKTRRKLRLQPEYFRKQ